MTDIRMESIYEVSKKIASGEVSPVDLVEDSLARIEKLEPELNAFITVLKDEARAEAKKAEKEIKEHGPKSPLHGIPVALKDLFYTKGVLTTAGSALTKDFVPTYDATVVTRLKEAGAIIIGKNNTHEFAFGPTTEDSCFGPARNPWNPKMIPGGSSGGSAASVAAGMVYVTMGTDSGGSVRIPAAMCGICGFKPTYGMASLYGVVPQTFSLDHSGPMARSVIDIAITMDAITGYDQNDPCPGRYTGEHTNYTEKVAKADRLDGYTLGIPTNFFCDDAIPGVLENYEKAIKVLESLGAKTKKVDLSFIDCIPEVSTVVMFTEAAWYHKELMAKHPEGYQKPVKARLDAGAAYTAMEYVEASQHRDKIVAQWEEALKDIDAVVIPTLPVTAFPVGTGMGNIVVNGKEMPARPLLPRNNRVANTTKGPALAVPSGLADGLPTSIEFMGKQYDDEKILEIGYAYEKAAPFAKITY